MSVLTIVRNTKKEERIEPDNISVIDWVSLGEGVRIQLLERRVAELEKFLKTHLHAPSGQAY